MSTAACCDDPGVAPAGGADGEPRPWWRDPALLLPALSGLAFGTGLVLKLSGVHTGATAVFWAGLLVGGYTFAPGAIRGLLTKRRLGIGLLMTISAVGAIILGFIEEAAALAFLYAIAEALEDRAMRRARTGLRALLDLMPETATIARAGGQVQVPVSEVEVGHVLVVRPGERVATDGEVRSGSSSVDTSAITGESIPVGVSPGDAVAAGAINSTGVLEIEATAPGTDNSLTAIVTLVEQAQAKKGDRARVADRIARPLVPGVMMLALLVGLIGALLGDPELWITRALVVLVAASPCALAIAVPVTVVSAIGAASEFGVIIKSGAAFEQLGEVAHVAFDKTGTLTRNRPTLSAVFPAPGVDGEQVVSYAAALERHSTHPLASAITGAATNLPAARGVSEEAGYGLSGVVDGRRVRVGSPRWIEAGALVGRVEHLEARGHTCVVVSLDGEVAGVIGVRDELRPEVPGVVTTLRRHGIEVSMLTGDNSRTAAALAQAAGISDVHAELRPEDKARIVAGFSEEAPTAMIGDGINDAPALAGATVGIAMGAAGADAAIESADVAFTGHDLALLPRGLEHARRGRAIINQNIALSLLIIAVLLPLAITGILGLAAVVLVHEVAEVIVIANGMRAARTRPQVDEDRALPAKLRAREPRLEHEAFH